MELRHLRYFVGVVEAGSLTEAAAERLLLLGAPFADWIVHRPGVRLPRLFKIRHVGLTPDRVVPFLTGSRVQ
jgi:hypothetical protein